MNQSPFPTQIRPFYKIIDADTIEELEEKVTQFMHDFDTESTNSLFLEGPQKIIEKDDEFWIQAMIVERLPKK